MENEITLRQILGILRRHLALILAAILLFGAGGWLVSRFFITPTYEADAMLIVNSNTETAGEGTSLTNEQLTSSRQLVSTCSVLLKSETVMENVIRELSLDTTPEKLAKEITVQSVDDTEVLKITVRHDSADTAQAIVTSLVSQAPDVLKNTVKAGKVNVVDAPRANKNPVAPSKMKNAFIAAVLGGVLSAGGCLLVALMRNRFLTAEDVRRELDVTVLGVVPSLTHKENAPLRQEVPRV